LPALNPSSNELRDRRAMIRRGLASVKRRPVPARGGRRPWRSARSIP